MTAPMTSASWYLGSTAVVTKLPQEAVPRLLCRHRKQDDELGRLIDQVTSETSSIVQGQHLKQQQRGQKEQQIQHLRGQARLCTSLDALQTYCWAGPPQANKSLAIFAVLDRHFTALTFLCVTAHVRSCHYALAQICCVSDHAS